MATLNSSNSVNNKFWESVSEGKLDEVKEFIKFGANVDFSSALFVACEKGHIEIVELLLTEGANPHLPDQTGKTPFNVCKTLELKTIFTNHHQRTLKELQELRKESTELRASIFDLEQLDININDLIFEKVIGRGYCTTTFYGRWKKVVVALKQFNISSSEYKESVIKNFEREISVTRKLRHPNIVRLYGVALKDGNHIIVQEYLPKGNLDDILHTQKIVIPFYKKIKLSMDIANGIAYLHSLRPKIIHRDLKSRNIFLDDNWNAKISDFGLVKIKTETRTVINIKTNSNDNEKPNWSPPEILDNTPYNEKVDVYSFGMILYEIETNTIPFYNKTNYIELITAILRNERPELPFSCNQDFRIITESCWSKDPSVRPSMLSILGKLESLISSVQQELFLSEFEFPLDLVNWKPQGSYYEVELKEPDNDFETNAESLEWKNMKKIFSKLHQTSSYKIRQALAIDNPLLKQQFKTKIDWVCGQMRNGVDWRGNQHWRLWVLDHLTDFAALFPNQIDEEIKIVPLFYLGEKEARTICESGFSFSQGPRGQGIYFTSNLKYALQNAGQGEQVVLITYVILGKVYPVIEETRQLPTNAERNCDSFFTIMKPGTSNPCRQEPVKDLEFKNSEFVVFENSYCLPKYLIFVKRQ